MISLCDVCAVYSAVVEGYIWRYAKRVGATFFFRGIRSWEKDGRDERALQILNTWGPILLGPLYMPIPTIYMEGNPKYNHVSSTLIREICTQMRVPSFNALSEDNDNNEQDKLMALSELVPPSVARKVVELYQEKKS
jgi:phosphopantetheine adenylyltransferase